MPLYFAHSRQHNLSLMSTNTLSALTQSNYSGLTGGMQSLGIQPVPGPASVAAPVGRCDLVTLQEESAQCDTEPGTGTLSLLGQAASTFFFQHQSLFWLFQLQLWVGTGCQTQERQAGTLYWPLVTAWWLPQMDSAFWGVAGDISGPAG